MIKNSLKLFGSYVAAAAVVAALDIAQAHAVGTVQGGATSAKAADQPGDLFGDAGVFSKISSVLLFIVGAVAVIMIVIGGLRYVISGGDSSQVQSAKNTILYALVGIIVAILAYAAVNFVINSFSATSGTPGGGGGGSTNYGASTR